jgi:hypothetical protein
MLHKSIALPNAILSHVYDNEAVYFHDMNLGADSELLSIRPENSFYFFVTICNGILLAPSPSHPTQTMATRQYRCLLSFSTLPQ